MPSPRVEYILTDIQGTPLGEITGAASRSLTVPHLRLPTASFTIPLWHKRADDLISQDTILRIYRTDSLGVRRIAFAGPVISVEEAANPEGQTIQANAVGPLWRLGKRLIGTSKAGYSDGTPASPTDLGLMMHNILDTVNGIGYTGISKGTRVASNSGVLAQVWLKNAGQQIAELSASINAPEFVVDPTEVSYPAGAFPQLGVLNVAPVIGGITRSDAIFEYGTGRGNIASYTRSRTLDGVLTQAFISVNGWPDGTTQDLRSDNRPAAIATRGVYEDVVNDAGILDDNLRDQLVDAHLDIRQGWRQTIVFTPTANARPSWQTDFNVGDYVRAISKVRGITRFDAFFRVWGVTLTYDEAGSESVEVELLPQSAG